jgi:hypothetical protein
MEARSPSRTAPRLETTATFALVTIELLSSALAANCSYASVVKPLSGKTGRLLSLNEKTSRSRSGV